MIALFGDPLDLHVIAVEEKLEARGVKARLFPQQQLDHGKEPFAALGPKGMRYLRDWKPRAAWLYRLPPPVVTPGPRFETLGMSNAAIALLLRWSEQKVRLVNPLGRVLVQNKLLQLDALKRARVPVPETRVCFTHEQVQAAARALAPAIAKPVSQGWHTIALDAHAKPPLPCLVQRRAPGDDLRITVVGSRIVSAVVIPNAGEVDFRANPAYGSGDIAYTEAELSKKEREIVKTTMKACGLVFGGIDVKRGPRQFQVLEANPAPAFLDVEQKLGHDISGALADFLSQNVRR